MPITQHNPAGVFPPYRACSHATEIKGGLRLLVISGLTATSWMAAQCLSPSTNRRT